MSILYVIPILAIIGTLSLVVSYVLFRTGQEEEYGERWCPFLTSVIFLIVGVALIFCSFGMVESKKPTAIDVYRGKTELIENGYMKDSIFVIKDSTIIFK